MYTFFGIHISRLFRSYLGRPQLIFLENGEKVNCFIRKLKNSNCKKWNNFQVSTNNNWIQLMVIESETYELVHGFFFRFKKNLIAILVMYFLFHMSAIQLRMPNQIVSSSLKHLNHHIFICLMAWRLRLSSPNGVSCIWIYFAGKTKQKHWTRIGLLNV